MLCNLDHLKRRKPCNKERKWYARVWRLLGFLWLVLLTYFSGRCENHLNWHRADVWMRQRHWENEMSACVYVCVVHTADRHMYSLCLHLSNPPTGFDPLQDSFVMQTNRHEGGGRQWVVEGRGNEAETAEQQPWHMWTHFIFCCSHQINEDDG